MHPSETTSIFLPFALFIIMLGLGLTLTMNDFKRVITFPKSVILGLFCQLILLPLIGFLICIGLKLPYEFAIGIMILAASPSGATSNLISHLSKANLALAVTLTACTSVLCIITSPLIISLALKYFTSQTQTIYLPLSATVFEVVKITIIPISIGMFIKYKANDFAAKIEKKVNIISAVLLLVIIVGAVLKNKEVFLRDDIWIIIFAAFLLNILSMLVGYYFPRLFSLTHKDRLTIAIESGIHNATLAILIATTILKNSEMAIPPAIYGLIMLVTGGSLVFITGRRKV